MLGIVDAACQSDRIGHQEQAEGGQLRRTVDQMSCCPWPTIGAAMWRHAYKRGPTFRPVPFEKVISEQPFSLTAS